MVDTKCTELSVSAKVLRQMVWELSNQVTMLAKLDASDESLADLDKLASMLLDVAVTFGQIETREK